MADDTPDWEQEASEVAPFGRSQYEAVTHPEPADDYVIPRAEQLASLLTEALDASEKVPCTRDDGYYCRIHFDTDLCPSCTTSLLIDRAYWAVTGHWYTQTSRWQ